MVDFAALFAANPPDPNEPLPLANKPTTVYGTTLPFHILSWAAVIFRLYTRFRIVHEPGWDDYLIILSAMFNLASLIGFYGCMAYGMGKHLPLLDIENSVMLFKFLYVQQAAYYACAGLVKLSLICQYLRLFRKGLLRKSCIVLLIITSLWACLWFLQGWVPCFPVSGLWNRLDGASAKCWGTVYGDPAQAQMTFVAFSASNMALDTIVFAIPVAIYFKPGISRKEFFALFALFSLGAIVVTMSILRLWTALRHPTGDADSLDFTWWYPLTLILSALEIDFAIICASIPIFWPVIVSALPQIFVTQEVRVTHQYRSSETNTIYEMRRPNSLKSNTSQEELTRQQDPQKTNYYGDQFVVNLVKGNVLGTTEVVSGKQNKRWNS